MRAIAAKRAAKYQLAVGLMEWPLFITLTVPHDQDDPLLQLRRLRRAFGKLRRHQLWKGKVKGGVAGLEINSRSGEFHPHLHAVIDCRWLAHFTPPPHHTDTRSRLKAKFKAASDELGLAWARCLEVKSINPSWCGVIFKVKRAQPGEIGREILKYSVKGSELVEWPGAVGPIIRALGSTRLVTSFGNLHGRTRPDDGTKPPAKECECCHCAEWQIDLPATRQEQEARANKLRRTPHFRQ